MKKQLTAALLCFGKECTSLANGPTDNSSVVYAYKFDDCKEVAIYYDRNKE